MCAGLSSRRVSAPRRMRVLDMTALCRLPSRPRSPPGESSLLGRTSNVAAATLPGKAIDRPTPTGAQARVDLIQRESGQHTPRAVVIAGRGGGSWARAAGCRETSPPSLTAVLAKDSSSLGREAEQAGRHAARTARVKREQGVCESIGSRNARRTLPHCSNPPSPLPPLLLASPPHYRSRIALSSRDHAACHKPLLQPATISR